MNMTTLYNLLRQKLIICSKIVRKNHISLSISAINLEQLSEYCFSVLSRNVQNTVHIHIENANF